MTDLAPLDTASPSDVPALCLLIADDMDERGEDGSGWRALGRLRKRPQYHANFTTWSWASQHPRRNMGHDLPFGWLDAVYRIHSPASYFTQGAYGMVASRCVETGNGIAKNSLAFACTLAMLHPIGANRQDVDNAGVG